MRISIAGNIIDFGFKDQIQDLWGTVEKSIRQPYGIDNTGELRARLEEAEQVLFLADNAGETVFDRVLIETLNKPVIYVVKKSPILNDATITDAVAAGLDGRAALVHNGSDAPGTIFPLCSDEFRQHFEEATVVIAKGQANYETLSESHKKVFCLLQVKCSIIARDIGAPAGSIVVRQSTTSPSPAWS
jgi:uncharacterized protein with ATP-grasp and redox domains